MMKYLLTGASAAVLMFATQAVAGNYSTAWQKQVSETATVTTSSDGGAGVTVGVVDTGIVASNPEVVGHVSALSSCAAVTFKCSNGVTDDNSHGTAVASILGGTFSSTAPMSGVAPNVTIVAEKVLNASGSGYDTDVANGIVKATQAGAKVINLSLTYMPTNAVVNAVNYAASKGVTIVWAGGNSAMPLNGGAPSVGFSAAVPSHIIFVGSVSPTNTLSSFSNTPGTGNITIGASNTSYASLWLDAPGQNIVAPWVTHNTYAYWTGTSMSTPEVAGAAALLDATWPVLVRNGTTSAVLFKTATSLGASGTFGNGLLDLDRAFQPIGTLTVTGANGVPIPLTALTGTMVSGGALGALSGVKSQLSSYTSFDAYQRNFMVNLSGIIATTSTLSYAQISKTPPVNTGVVGTTGGQFMLVGLALNSSAESAAGILGASSGDQTSPGARAPDPVYVAFAGNDGTFWAVGQSVSSSLGFAQATWGADSPVAQQADGLGVASALVDLAQGGRSATMGQAVGPVRFAASWSSSPDPVGSLQASDRNRSDSSVMALAVTAKMNSHWSVGATYSNLKEDNGLLGSVYQGLGPLSLGARHQSQLLGLSSVLDLGSGRAFLAEASTVSSDGASMQSGLIQSVSPLRAAAWGVSFVQSGAMVGGDALTLSLRQPLRVISGQAQMLTTSVDDQGYATTTLMPVSLAPSGHETDLILNYAAPVSKSASLDGGVSLRSDAENQAGVDAIDLHLGLNVLF